MTRNVTLSLPDEIVKQAKIVAAQRETSLSGLVASLLKQVIGDAEDYDAVWERELAIMAAGPLRVGKITWSRDDLHQR